MSIVVTNDNMAEFIAQRMGLDAPQQEAPAAEEAKDSDAKPVEEATTQEQEQEGKKSNPKIERRFSELTKQREEARREAERLRGEKEALEAKLREREAPTPTPEPVQRADPADKPQADDYADAFAYAEALAIWSAEQALLARDRAEQERKTKAEQETAAKAWEQRIAKASREIEDYQDVVEGSDVQVSDQVRAAILDSELGPQLIYHLAKNPDVAERIAGMTVMGALRELGRIEARLSDDVPAARPAARPSKAPPPINPIRATRPVEDYQTSNGEFNGDFRQWKEARRAGRIR
jgi:hypothetical protein